MSDQDHKLLPQLKTQLQGGQMDRRQFVRFCALLGVSLAAAYEMAGGASPARADSAAYPPSNPQAKHGGTLRVGHLVAKMEDPATYSWNEMANQTRPITEYMTVLGTDNIIHPMLIESWKPSDDLKTWTLNVRKGVQWHNGEELVADHVAWNIRRWTDSATGSSSLGLSTFSALSVTTGDKDAKGKPVKKPAPNGVEVVDSHTLRLNLSTPVLSVAEDCAEYSTMIVHPSFKAPFSDNPMGTGPFTLSELKVGDRCILKRVKTTTDGKPFTYWGGDVYLDEIHFYNYDQENSPSALASNTIDALYELNIEQMELAKSIDGAKILSVNTANTLCCRMQIDQKPFDDIRVRKAIVMAVDNGAIKNLIFPDGGYPAYNFHVSPVHPEYFPLPVKQPDPEGAKKLLADAGHADGLELTITTGNTDGPWHQAVCEAIRDQLSNVGIKLNINVLPTTKFWEIWDKTPFGTTPWDNRPLGTMALAQAYKTGVPWNETHFSDPEFDKALADAESTIDVAARKAKMEKVEKILQDAALMIEPFWRPIYTLVSGKVRDYNPHPARMMLLTKVWLDA